MKKTKKKDKRKQAIYRVIQTLKMVDAKNQHVENAEAALYGGKVDQAEQAVLKYCGVDTDQVRLQHSEALSHLADQLDHMTGAGSVTHTRVKKYADQLRQSVNA